MSRWTFFVGVIGWTLDSARATTQTCVGNTALENATTSSRQGRIVSPVATESPRTAVGRARWASGAEADTCRPVRSGRTVFQSVFTNS